MVFFWFLTEWFLFVMIFSGSLGSTFVSWMLNFEFQLFNTGPFLGTLSFKITNILVSNETFLLGRFFESEALTICGDIYLENRRDVSPTDIFFFKFTLCLFHHKNTEGATRCGEEAGRQDGGREGVGDRGVSRTLWHGALLRGGKVGGAGRSRESGVWMAVVM